MYVGLARTIYTHRIWPYTWWDPCQEYRIYIVYMWFWPTLNICTWMLTVMTQKLYIKQTHWTSDALDPLDAVDRCTGLHWSTYLFIWPPLIYPWQKPSVLQSMQGPLAFWAACASACFVCAHGGVPPFRPSTLVQDPLIISTQPLLLLLLPLLPGLCLSQ